MRVCRAYQGYVKFGRQQQSTQWMDLDRKIRCEDFHTAVKQKVLADETVKGRPQPQIMTGISRTSLRRKSTFHSMNY